MGAAIVTDVVQLRLVEIPQELTDRHQTAYDAIVAAGRDGLHHDELGALDHQRRGKHAADETCAFCGRDGKALGHELRAKGLVTLRRRSPAAWTVSGKLPASSVAPSSEVAKQEVPDGEWAGDGPIPYGVIPFRPTVACAARTGVSARSVAA